MYRGQLVVRRRGRRPGHRYIQQRRIVRSDDRAPRAARIRDNRLARGLDAISRGGIAKRSFTVRSFTVRSLAMGSLSARSFVISSLVLGSLVLRSFVTRSLVTRSVAVKSKRRKPRIQHPRHLASFRRPLRLGRALTLVRRRTLTATPRTARSRWMRLRRMLLVEILQLECPAKPLQFKDQRRALRPDRSIIERTGPARRHSFVVVRTIHDPHDGTLSASVFG
jgi:hypothetical protein